MIKTYNKKLALASRRGRINRAEGAEFEKLIEISCEYYKEKGLAYIEKTPEPFRVTRKLDKGQFIGHFTKQAQPDFKGTLKGGKAIVFDAKCTMTDSIQITKLSDEQHYSLKRHDTLGALAGVLLCFSFKTFVWLPIFTFENAKHYNGHQYWTAYEALKYGLEIRFTGSMLGLEELITDDYKR